MLTLSYMLQNGPQLVTNLIAWVAVALAFVAALAGWRAARAERSCLVVTKMDTMATGAVVLTLTNLGKRFGLEIVVETQPGISVRHGGIAGGGRARLHLPGIPSSPATLKLAWIDADGRTRKTSVTFEADNRNWRRLP